MGMRRDQVEPAELLALGDGLNYLFVCQNFILEFPLSDTYGSHYEEAVGDTEAVVTGRAKKLAVLASSKSQLGLIYQVYLRSSGSVFTENGSNRLRA